MKTNHPRKQTRILASSLIALFGAALPQLAHAADGTWTQTTSGGLWSDTANWSGGTEATAGSANFNTIDITADNTVHLDGARTITSLTFGDTVTGTAASWILDNNGISTNTLTLGGPNLTVNDLGAGATATISAVIAGTSPSITKLGNGTLVLSGANTFTKATNNTVYAMRLTAGTVIIASDSAFGAYTAGFAGDGLLNLNGATLQASGSARDVGNPIWLNGSTTVVSGSQSLTFSGAAMGRGGNPTVTNNITGGGTLSLTGNVYTDNLSGSKIITFNGTGNTLISGVIANNTANFVGPNGAIIKSGAGTLTLSNTASTYTGVTTINAGVMEAAALDNGGTASSIGQSTNAAANLVFGAPTATLRYNGSTSPTIDRGFTLSSGTGGGATIESSGSGTLTIDNTVALAYGTTGQTRLLTLGGTNTGANTFSKVIANNGSGATSLTKDGAGTWNLSAANTYTGNTTVNAGTLTLDAAGTLKFVPTGNGVCNKVTGAGTATLNGTFDIDLTNAAIDNGNSWTLVDTTVKNGALTAVTGFSGSAGVWTKVDGGNTWTYTESTGVLGLVISGPGPLDHFAISAISSPQTVGTPITGITLTAQDASNATVTSFTGTVTFGGTGGFSGTSANFVLGVLNSVSVTPTVAGSNLTLTVDDDSGPSIGSTTITTIQTQYQFWAGGAIFGDDANGDGVSNGLAFLLGAGGPNDNALGLLPEVIESGGGLVLTFDMLDTASRGTATLSVEHSSDLGIIDLWEAASVPDVDNTVNDVVFDISGSGTLGVEATIPSSKAAGGKLFGRLKATQP